MNGFDVGKAGWALDPRHLPTDLAGEIACQGAEEVWVRFAAPMAAADYRVKLSTSRDQVTGGAVVPSWGDRTALGFTVFFSAPFTGTLQWEVHRAAAP